MMTFWILLNFSLSRSRWVILGWAIPMFLIGYIMMPFFDLLMEVKDPFLEMVKVLPKNMMAFAGGKMITEILQPEGFVSLRYFAPVPLIFGIYAAVTGSGLLVADENRGFLDFIMAHPVSRKNIFLSRLCAWFLGVTIILAFSWIGLWLGTLKSQSMSFSLLDLLPPFFAVGAFTTFCGTFALALSLILPNRSAAAMTIGIYVFAGHIISNLAKVIDSLLFWSQLTPNHYFLPGANLAIDMNWLAGLTGFSVLFSCFAYFSFMNRDLSVSGDSGWRSPLRR